MQARLKLAPTRLWYPDRRQLTIECQGAWRARSFHVELVTPDELRIEQAIIWDSSAKQPLSETDSNENRASLYAGDVPVEAEAVMFAVVAPERSGGMWQYMFAGLTVVGFLWLGVLSGLKISEPGQQLKS